MPAPDLTSRILYRDGLLLVVDKPAGIPVHAGPGGGDNLEAGFDALRFGLPHPPALAHRLDRDTSGCLALGRHRKALSKLGRLFQEGRVGKTYWAVLDGVPEANSGRIELGLTKQTRRNGWRMIVDPAGQAAATEYVVLGSAGGRSWVAFTPHTGRTHQIRVHAASGLGCPVLGDGQYGLGDGPLHLHSRRLVLPLYPKRDPIDVTAPVPAHMRAALEACGFDPAVDAAIAMVQPSPR
jgi:RluA family pseudouridine synthase